MYCSDSKPWLILAWNTLIAAVASIGVHFLFYGIKDPSAYNWSAVTIIITVLLALAYAHLFNKVSRNWRLDYSKGFVHVKSGGSQLCGNSWTNFFNALIFAVLVIAIVLTVMALAGVFVSTIFIYILDGIRGAVPPLDADSATSTAAQIGVATISMDLMGKTEDQPRTP